MSKDNKALPVGVWLREGSFVYLLEHVGYERRSGEQLRNRFSFGVHSSPSVGTEEEHATAEVLRSAFETAAERDRLAAENAELLAALEAMRVVMDMGPKPRKLDAALSWRECDEKARAMCDAAIGRVRGGGR